MCWHNVCATATACPQHKPAAQPQAIALKLVQHPDWNQAVVETGAEQFTSVIQSHIKFTNPG